MSVGGISAIDTMRRSQVAVQCSHLFGCSVHLVPKISGKTTQAWDTVHQGEGLFYSTPSKYLWEDDEGVRHTIHQGEGGEQGDALMPLLFCVGQHAAFEAMQRGLNPDEKLLAFLDDLYLVSLPERVGAMHNLAQHELWTHCRIRVHGGKRLEPIRTQTRPTARVWRGSEVPTVEQGIKVLCTPIGHNDHVLQLLTKIQDKHRVLLDVIPTVPDIQSAWLLLLHCASARANCCIRVVRPKLVNTFADQELWQCLCTTVTRATASLPLSLGGMGLRSARELVPVSSGGRARSSSVFA